MEALRNLGLTKYEAATYTALLKTGPADARRIAKASAVPPTAVYPSIKQLILRGLVQQLSGDVALYEALDPNIALPAMAEHERQSMQQRVQHAVEQLKEIKADPLAIPEPVSLFEGIDTSHEIFSAFVSRTEQSLWIVGWGFGNVKYVQRNIRKLAELTKTGKKVRLITTVSNYQTNEVIKQLRAAEVSVRYLQLQNFSIIIRDQEESKITLKNRDLGQHTNLHVHDKDFSRALSEYFETIWKKAKRI